MLFILLQPKLLHGSQIGYSASEIRYIALKSFRELSNTSQQGTPLDKFGVLEIYPTLFQNRTWFMDMKSPANDSRLLDDLQELWKSPDVMTQRNDDGSWNVNIKPADPSKAKVDVRIKVQTLSDYNSTVVKDSSLNQTLLSKRGYMQSSDDWRNVEMTGYVKFKVGMKKTTWFG